MKKTLLLLFIISLVCGCKDDDTPAIDREFTFYNTLSHGGKDRTYRLHLPSSYYDNSNQLALVIGLHGGGGSSEQFETSSKLSEKSDEAGFIVVYPEGLETAGGLKLRSWNAGKCCGSNVTTNTDDVGFISKLIDELDQKFRVDIKKVYATGHSNGAMLCHRLACELAGKIAAVAPNSGSMQVKNPCAPSRPVPVLYMHSKLDQNVPYLGGLGTKGVTNAWHPPVDSSLNVHASSANCTISKQLITTSTLYTFWKWHNCNNGSEVHYYLTEDGGHSWPGGESDSVGDSDPSSKAFIANDLIWEFFNKYSLP